MKILQKILVGFVLGSLFISCQAQSEKNTAVVEVLSTEEFSVKLNESQNPQLIDVRTSAEYGAGHIDNSLNWDYTNGDFEKNIPRLNKDSVVFLYCASGNRSGKAGELLKKHGFTKIYDLKGGYAAWKKEK